ncbi:HlyD family efflux transporter periplasmic adaptor subunit [Amnibacterium kyonggiense]|uniref:Biotin/lipoyl-binding protein n=1 Tax=Amnibacterium kyonggiense TaxID=595671 RepID=A0A4V3EA68_9MICO|nr:HlyD family efflux transporter periplasmic adaptor subunit [Amnibacterium kyonggiense]TDS74874.1 biotin/lipoyl-binding protein [Amnibacterium kyonggiense]
MTWGNRARLFFGSIGVLVLVAALTIVFNQRQHSATSETATITAVDYPVGSTYSGTVTDVLVTEGEQVRKGDPLISVRSASLLHDLRQGVVTAQSVGYSVSSTGIIRFESAVDGTVHGLDVQTGMFVPAGSTLLTVAKTGSLSVSARLSLTPTDYGRLAKGASVDLVLPDQTTIPGRVDEVSVSTANSRAVAQIDVVSFRLRDDADGGLIQAGTPVTAIVHLRDDGPLAGVVDAGTALLRKVGL